MAGEAPITFGATTALAATSSTGNAALPAKTSNQIVMTNLGPDLAYIAFGADNTVTATTANFPLMPGAQIGVTIAPEIDFVAAICPTSTAALRFTAGDGYVSGLGAASTGSASSMSPNVNIAQVGGSSSAIANGLVPTGPDESPVSGSVTSQANLFTADMLGYESISVQVTSAGSVCTITYETSDDNTNWVAAGSRLVSASAATTVLQGTSSTAIMLVFPKNGRYFRARVSTYGSGTVTVVGNMHKNPQPLTNRITVDGSSTVAVGAATTGFFVENHYSYGRVTADGQIKATAGFVHSVTIAPTGTVTAGVLTIYDSASETGTVIMSVALPVTTFTPFTVMLDVVAGTGIYVGFDATLANVQATVSFR